MEYSRVLDAEFFTFLHVIFKKDVKGHRGDDIESSPQPVRLCSLRYPLCSSAKLAKRGPPYCGEFGSGIFRWGATIRLDTLPALFAFI